MTPRSLTISADGARQALLDHFRVNKLSQDVADLKAIIVQKDTIIARLNRSVRTITIASPEPKARSQIGPILSPSTSQPAIRLNWPKVENWCWRGLFVYVGVQAIRAVITQ